MTYRNARACVTIVAIAAVCVAGAGTSLARQGPASDDAKVAAALLKGEASLRARAYQDALDVFKQASSLAHKTSAAAFYGVARAAHGLGDFSAEVSACTDALKIVGDDVRLEVALRNQRGLALVGQSDRNGARALRDAETEFRKVLTLPGAPAVTSYNLGVVLLKQNRDDEGIEVLKAYVGAGARTPEADTARAMMVNPRRAREPYAPIFRLTTLEEQPLNLEDLAGKVVVLDFWGTWCGPCRASTPSLVEINRRYAKRPFVFVGISSDPPSDRSKVVTYAASNQMTWPEYIDANRQIERIYDVHSFPTWIVIDAEGIIRDRIEAWGSTTRDDLTRAIDRALKSVKAPSANR